MSCSSWSRDSTDLVNRGNYILRPVMIKVQIDQSSFHMDVSRCILFKAVLFRVNFKSTNYLRYIRSIIVAAMFSSKRLCQISLQTHIHSVCLCVTVQQRTDHLWSRGPQDATWGSEYVCECVFSAYSSNTGLCLMVRQAFAMHQWMTGEAGREVHFTIEASCLL